MINKLVSKNTEKEKEIATERYVYTTCHGTQKINERTHMIYYYKTLLGFISNSKKAFCSKRKEKNGVEGRSSGVKRFSLN